MNCVLYWRKGSILLVVAVGLCLNLIMNTAVARAAPADMNALAQIVKEIDLGKPLPDVNYLRPASAWNKGEQRFEGKYANWSITILIEEVSGNVSSILLKKPGEDNLEELLPPLVKKYGQAKYSESLPGAIKARSYGWPTGETRNTSLWYQFNTVSFTDSYN